MSENKIIQQEQNEYFIRQYIEKQYQIQVIYACEGGSRGWGTHNEDSDYDLRGIYILSEEHYISVQKSKGIISNQSQIIPNTKVLFDYIFIDFRKFLKRNVQNERNQLNLILQSQNWYINKFPQDILNYLKSNLPIPIKGIRGHINDLVKRLQNAQIITPKQALNCLIYGFQLIHIYIFNSMPFYSSLDEINFLKQHLAQNKDIPNIQQQQQQNELLNYIFEKFQVEYFLGKFSEYLDLKIRKQQYIPEQDNQMIQNFIQDIISYKNKNDTRPLSASELNLQFKKLLQFLSQSEK